MKFESICVVGDGRVGAAVAARLRERARTWISGRELACAGADLVLLCVPDRAIATVARQIPSGAWLAHTSGAAGLDELAPHTRRFALHPLQTFTHERGPEQLDGAWAAVTAETDDALAAAVELARLLDVEPFELADEDRPLYHAGAVVAASFLVTLHDIAADLVATAGAPVEALVPLMRRTIDNGFEPTGPHVRGDRETVERHLEAIRERRPELEPVYRALAEATEKALDVARA